MKVPEISIIICTYNRKDLLAKALPCIMTQKSDGRFFFDIVVIDDGSTDGTEQLVNKLSTATPISMKYVNTQGKGVSHARNRGVRESRAGWLAFFDQDQLAEPHWMGHLFDEALSSGASIVDGPRDLALSPAQLSKLSETCRRILGERLGPLAGRWNTRESPNTGNVLISRKVFEELGGFDESIITGGEDLDFFMKAKNAGFTIGYAQKAIVHHLIPSERLTPEFFKWNSQRCGINFAAMDYKYSGPVKTMAFGFARLGQALLINMPKLLYKLWTGDRVEAFGLKCLLWRAQGYLRMCLFLFAPSWFAQQRFLGNLEFRKEKLMVKAGAP